MISRGRGSLIGIVVIALTGLILTIMAGNTPLLGLDLQGGVEVVLEPVDTPENLALATPENLDRAVEIVRKRVDAIGVAEPDITTQTGDNNFIIVQLPGIEDQSRAVELVGQTAQLRFRPVLITVPVSQIGAARAAVEAERGDADTGGSGDSLGSSGSDGGDVSDPPEATDDGTDEGSIDDLSGLVPGGETALGALAQNDDGADEGTDDGADDGGTEAPEEVPGSTSPFLEGEEQDDGTTRLGLFPESITRGGPGLDELINDVVSDPVFADPDQSAIYNGPEGPGQERFLLGPALFDGTALQGASAQNVSAGQWIVTIEFENGPTGMDLFNSAAAQCFSRTDVCPTGLLAIVLDGTVESAPVIRAPVFDGNTVTLSRGDVGFTDDAAKDIALVLDFGALPLAFADPADPEAGLVRTVSATLGRDSLNAGLIAGLVGVFLVALYMIWYYRLLGLAAMLSLILSATMLWVIVSFLSSTSGLALTLAGVVGLIVSIGVSLDSNVVYFEHVKDDMAQGRTLLSSVDKSFPVAFSTVFWANMATLIGAVILYFLTVGSVKGFALMLGIASILDLVATYFFMAPLVKLLATKFIEKPQFFGLRSKPSDAVAGAST